MPAPTRLLHALRALSIAGVLVLTACASGKGARDDAGPDTGDAGPGTGDAALPPDAAPQVPTRYGPTSGGGTAASPNYRATIRIGGPQPAGSTSSDTHEADLGAGAGAP